MITRSMKPKKQEVRRILEEEKVEKLKCWEVFKCRQKRCPAYKSKSLGCWLFSGKGGLIEIVTDVKDDSTVRLSVRDNGPGIPDDILKHIFEPFFTTKEKGKGTGLGLSISYGIMQKLGGTILVQSEVNKGTTFTLEIPQKTGSV